MLEKILKSAAAISAAAGVLIIFGTVGASDYYVEIGEYYPLTEMIKWSAIGFFCIIPALVIFRKELDE